MMVIAMSRREIDRMQVLRDVMARHIPVRDAAQLLPLARRQVFRLLISSAALLAPQSPSAPLTECSKISKE